MNPTIIQALSTATLDGSMPFPEIVGKLIEQGVEYYHVDYVIWIVKPSLSKFNS